MVGGAPLGTLGSAPPGPGKFVKIASWRSWGALGSLLASFWSRFAALGCFLGAPAPSDRPPGPPAGLRGRFWEPFWLHFWSILGDFGGFLWVRCAVRFQAAFGAVFYAIFNVFGRARKTPKGKNRHTLRAKTLFFQGARLRRRRHKGDNRRPRKPPKISTKKNQ